MIIYASPCRTCMKRPIEFGKRDMKKQKHCCESDCVGCEIFAAKKEKLKKAQKASQSSSEDILWNR
ncbi:hypothetical protein SAMN06296036_10666 [Pseudobacteriovorax antillogorgiicola]|uniref:Uncharacterized protein n=1 Tax=Pseudobacteriovorax antillogorgiicola TaxID=1513793 RepID=A0A1Y6BM62_9BACT|nr:hypothetical protein EDD56_106177 [Pseudobacteriovorax antillogorgiicola]SMF16772.1 hypothetical protein SAMN06296036_10666 [Pseudobacteriovorax antillogorgiicola]